jgi:hypothetical protein
VLYARESCLLDQPGWKHFKHIAKNEKKLTCIVNLNAVPLTCLKGITVDTSVLLRFHFWQTVHFKLSESSFPSESKKALGHVVGISEHCGHALTYKFRSSESDVII